MQLHSSAAFMLLLRFKPTTRLVILHHPITPSPLIRIISPITHPSPHQAWSLPAHGADPPPQMPPRTGFGVLCTGIDCQEQGQE